MRVKNKVNVNRVNIVFCLILLFIFQTEVFAMSFFGKKVCVFSAVNGKVVQQGEPIINATIRRTYTWDSKDYTDEVSTDENGYFSFPEKFESSVWAFFPHNPSIIQFVKIQVENNEYQAWGFQKGNYDVNGELDGKPMKLLCDLDSPKVTHKVNEFKNYVGICQIK